jgi:hypothetical protein
MPAERLAGSARQCACEIQSSEPSETYLKANFYEKALFVKVHLATALWWTRLFPALRAMLLFALSGSSLGSSVHYEIRLDSS